MERYGREELARQHIGLVDTLINKEIRKLGLSRQTIDDVRSFALEGLAAALERYDSEKGVPFKAYAKIRIRWSIYDGLERQGWFPRRLKRKINFYRKADEMLQYKSANPPPRDKLEAVHRLSDSLKELATAYVTTYAAEEENEPVSVDPVIEEELDIRKLTRLLVIYIGALPSKQRTVLQNYFFEDQKLNEIAAQMGVTTSWVSKLLTAGLSRLRQALEGQTEIQESVRSAIP
jgi:RNA polymerase sigma factor for flagellar operon FliA